MNLFEFENNFENIVWDRSYIRHRLIDWGIPVQFKVNCFEKSCSLTSEVDKIRSLEIGEWKGRFAEVLAHALS